MPPSTADFTSREFRNALGKFPTGVTIITARDPVNNQPLGLTIGSFGSVSLEPPMILWSLTHTALSLQAFLELDRYVVHVLSAGQKDLAKRFASGSQSDRFKDLELNQAPNGTVQIASNNFAARFECYNTQQHLAGDHTIFVGQVENCHYQDLPPLIYHTGNFDLTPSLPIHNV